MGALSSCCKCKRDDEETAKDYGMIDWKDRKCRDILFCILFALFWLGMIIIGALGLSWGDPARLGAFREEYTGEERKSLHTLFGILRFFGQEGSGCPVGGTRILLPKQGE